MDTSIQTMVVALQKLEAKLRGYASRCGHHDPEEFFGHVWSRCIEYASTQPLLDQVEPLIWRIARDKLIHFYRTRCRIPIVLQLDINPEEISIPAVAADHENKVSEALAELSSRDQDAFCLKHLYYWDNSEIAAELGLTKGGVRTLMHRTKQRLAKRLAQYKLASRN